MDFTLDAEQAALRDAVQEFGIRISEIVGYETDPKGRRR